MRGTVLRSKVRKADLMAHAIRWEGGYNKRAAMTCRRHLKRTELACLAAALVLLGCDPAVAQQPQDLLVATRRAGLVEFFNSDTLEPLGHMRVAQAAESVSAAPDGRRLFVAMWLSPRECCGLFSLDLGTKRMCELIEPAQEGVPSPDGRLYTQRGNVGIEVFDLKSLARLPCVRAPGVYSLFPSPDGRWLFGTTVEKGPSLDVFDAEKGGLVRRLPVPVRFPTGTWFGGSFYLYGQYRKNGKLWTVSPQAEALGPGIKIGLPDLAADCQPLIQNFGASGHLFLYERFGYTLDRRRRCSTHVLSGAFVIDPSTGAVLSHIASSFHFAYLVASPGGQRLYGIDGGGPDWEGPVRLVKLNPETGEVLLRRTVETDYWSVAVATVTDLLVPRGEVQALPCQVPEDRVHQRIPNIPGLRAH
jgi:hypothetical protein